MNRCREDMDVRVLFTRKVCSCDLNVRGILNECLKQPDPHHCLLLTARHRDCPSLAEQRWTEKNFADLF